MKKKKRLFVLLVIVLVIIGIIVFAKRPKSYTLEYDVADYKISEEYDKDKKYYAFSLTVDDRQFDFAKESKYLNKKKIIDGVQVISNDEELCVLIQSEMLDLYPICSNEDGYYDYSLSEISSDEYYKREKAKVVGENAWNISVNSLNERNYLVWASKGYYFLSDNGNKEIMFLNEDSYYNSLGMQVGQYVLTPDYDQDYVFTKIYIIDMKTGKLSTWDLDYEISFNSYYLGSKDGIGYLVDNKNKVEYALNPKKKKIEIVSKDGYGQVWSNGWESVSLVKLTSDNYAFEDEKIYNYDFGSNKILLNTLKSKISVLVSAKTATKTVSQNGDAIYYLVKDELYEYSLKYGETLLLKYSEWNFNNINSIFIY